MKKICFAIFSSAVLLTSCTKEENILNKDENVLNKDEFSAFINMKTQTENMYNLKYDENITPTGALQIRCVDPGNDCYKVGDVIYKKATPIANGLINAIENGRVSEFVNNEEFSIIFPGIHNSEILDKLKSNEYTIRLAPTEKTYLMFVITKSESNSFNEADVILATYFENIK